jgi:hypothetical protein
LFNRWQVRRLLLNDGRLVVYCSIEGRLEVSRLLLNRWQVIGVYCSIDGRLDVYCSIDGRLVVYCSIDGRLVVYCSIDGRLVVYCSIDGRSGVSNTKADCSLIF